jgi:hypothetical protein
MWPKDNTDTAEPHRVKLRREILEPRFAKFTTLKFNTDPTAVTPTTLMPEPIREYERMLRPLPTFKKSSAETALPRRA